MSEDFAIATVVLREIVEAARREVMAELLASGYPFEAEDAGFLDVRGAAEFLSCPKSRIYKLVSQKAIPFEKDGSRTLFDRRELRAFVMRGGARTP